MIYVSRLLSTTIAFLITLVCFGIFTFQVKAMECATGYEPNADDTGCIYTGGNAQETDDQYRSVDSVSENPYVDGGGMLAPVDGGGGASTDGGGMLAPADGASGNSNSDTKTSNTNSETRTSNKNTSSGETGKLSNPIGSDSIEEFILKIIDVLLVFAIPIIMLYIMYAGYLFVTAQGDSGQITTARSALLWAVVGGVIVLGAKVIVEVIQGTIEAF
jgi:hypothetical protein